ncbi:MAG TPA: ribonuclease E/G [Rhizomicrobium sp.]|nr:ribonuclease E/G [Rhizomicrobium sp.]
MPRELLINAGAGETRVALVEAGRLEGFWAEPAIGAAAGRLGEIRLARVAKVVPAMQAAFVDLGLGRDGFLSLRDAPALHEGQAVVVEITREADGAKGVKLTARTSLAPELETRRKTATPPHLLRAGPGVIEQALKAVPEGTEIYVDDARQAQALCQAFPHLQVTPAREDLFSRHDLEEQVAARFHPRVALRCGGWITIQPTEGMTAIDVNSGGFSASGGREETAHAVNLEAAREIGRQLRLRGIGGLIVIDFIQMEDGRAVVAALKQALKQDMGDDSRISPMADFGIVAIARRRRGAPLAGRQPCSCCNASGWVATAQAQALAILRQVERSARAAPGREIVVRAGAAVIEWLAAHEAAVRAGLDRRGVGRVRYVPENREDFDVAT